jgi:hypothetical protein
MSLHGNNFMTTRGSRGKCAPVTVLFWLAFFLPGSGAKDKNEPFTVL